MDQKRENYDNPTIKQSYSGISFIILSLALFVAVLVFGVPYLGLTFPDEDNFLIIIPIVASLSTIFSMSFDFGRHPKVVYINIISAMVFNILIVSTLPHFRIDIDSMALWIGSVFGCVLLANVYWFIANRLIFRSRYAINLKLSDIAINIALATVFTIIAIVVYIFVFGLAPQDFFDFIIEVPYFFVIVYLLFFCINRWMIRTYDGQFKVEALTFQTLVSVSIFMFLCSKLITGSTLF